MANRLVHVLVRKTIAKVSLQIIWEDDLERRRRLMSACLRLMAWRDNR